MTLLERVGDWLTANARAVRDSPPLAGLVAGVWMFLLVLASGGNPVTAFLVFAPLVTLGMYAVDRLFGTRRDDGEEAGANDAPAPYEYDSDYEPADEESAVERLRDRYAAGDIEHDEFERRLDALLETEGFSSGAPGRTERGGGRGPPGARPLERNETGR